MQVTVNSTTIPNYQGGGSTAEIRIYATENFFGGGVEYVAGLGYFYESVDCTVAGDVITVPSFQLESTTDSTNDTAKYVAILYNALGGKVTTLMGGLEFSVPPLTPTTWLDLQIGAQAVRRRLPDTYYTSQQVDLLLDGADLSQEISDEQAARIAGDADLQDQIDNIAIEDASDVVKGITALSKAPASPTAPIAAGINDPRVTSTIGTLDAAGTGTLSPAATAFEYDVVRVTGVLTGDRTINWPGDSTDRRTIILWNDTTGDFELYIKQTVEAGTGIRTTRNAQSILINDGTEVIDVTAAVTRVPFYVLEWDGTPKTVNMGFRFYPFDVDLGPCFYECWIKRGPGHVAGQYDFSEGYGGAHAMLRNPINGNTYRGILVTDASNTTPIVITTSKPHGLTTGGGQLISIDGVLGNTNANVVNPTITVLTSTTFEIDGTVGNGQYLGGGVGGGAGGVGNWGVVDFQSDHYPYVGQWAHSATSIANADYGVGAVAIISYYDGVPVGYIPFAGVRMCRQNGGNGGAFIGGSDHSNWKGRIAQYRIFEGSSPRYCAVGWEPPIAAFAPETVFGNEAIDHDGNVHQASVLYSFFQPNQMIADLGIGYPPGRTHTARIYGSGNGITSTTSDYPAPEYVIDAEAPNSLALVAPVQPAGRVYAPLAPPVGALAYDSIERKNSTFAFDGLGGIGFTESGSLGPLEWKYLTPVAANLPKPFGILNEMFVPLGGQTAQGAYVELGQANLDIEVTRVISASSGGTCSIAFRVGDQNNYWCFATDAASRTPQAAANVNVYINKVVAGVTINIYNTPTANDFDTMRVVTKPDGTYEVYKDATLLTSGNDPDLASNENAGIINVGNGAALSHRWKFFTVKSAA